MKSKQEIYDEQIAPLINHIIDICEEHDIRMISSFMTDRTENQDYYMTSCCKVIEGEIPECRLFSALQIIWPEKFGELGETSPSSLQEQS